MDTTSIDWLTALAFAIIGGGLIGLVMGHKIKDGPTKVLTTPMIFQTGATNTVLAYYWTRSYSFMFHYERLARRSCRSARLYSRVHRRC